MLISRRRLLQLSAGACLSGIWPGQVLAGAGSTRVRVETGPAFGSAWRAVLPQTEEARFARAQIEAAIQRVDEWMSPFRRDSDVARFNLGEGGAVEASSATCEVLKNALALAKASGGAFDPTSAPLGRRFGFGVPWVSARRPTGCFSDIRVLGRSIQSERRGASLDLCGIAKGYALDEIRARLEGLDFLIELGGEIIARGVHPTGRPWHVGIERPGSDRLQRLVAIDGWALATSGDGANGYATSTGHYAHVVDPRTGRAVESGVASVSVLAPTGQLADALSTAALVMGPEQARDLIGAYDASALFLMRDEAGGLREVNVFGFLRRAAI